jgi:GTP cyclohydrolase II
LLNGGRGLPAGRPAALLLAPLQQFKQEETPREIVEKLSISFSPNPHNEKYLETKRIRMRHTL